MIIQHNHFGNLLAFNFLAPCGTRSLHHTGEDTKPNPARSPHYGQFEWRH